MKIFSFLLRESRAALIGSVLTGLLSGAANTGLLVLINSTLAGDRWRPLALVWGFAGLCLAATLTRGASNVLLIRLGEKTMSDLRIELSDRILATPLHHLERLGAPRLLAMLTGDIPTITNAITLVPEAAISASIVLGCLVYLGWLSLPALAVFLLFLVLGAAGYHLAIRRAVRHFTAAREEGDHLLAHFRALLEGTKELKIHRERRQSFLGQVLRSTVDRVYDSSIRGGTVYAMAEGWGRLMIFVIIGALLFALPVLIEVDEQTLTGYILGLLYLIVPLQSVLNSLPLFGRAEVALSRVREMELDLEAHATDLGAASLGAGPRWSRLDLVDVTYSYEREGGDGRFSVGPLSLHLTPGEVVFLVGGNGSGKTTLAKLLLGLYSPASGEIRLDGERITEANRESYRQYFSVVFSDFFLFPSLLGLEGAEEGRVRDYLSQLELDHKVRVENGALSTTDLSQGQRKRLALLTAYLEDRPIYLFDEWAADQDPVYREIFYRQILPRLKARGKAVVVISHDDRYYDAGDRLIKLDYGRIASERASLVGSVLV